MNTIVERASSDNKDLLSFYDVIPYNQKENEWIHYYATGLYSKWEAEDDQQASDEVGMKHATGVSAFFNGANCWSSLGTAPACSLMYGPHYRQEKDYKRWQWNTGTVNYIARYRMALHNFGGANINEDICKIYIKVRHNRFINGHPDPIHPVVDDILQEPKILKVSHFPTNGDFQEFYFDSPTFNPTRSLPIFIV